MLIDGVKFSCSACIKGHRSSNCQHSDRELFEIARKGRPKKECNAETCAKAEGRSKRCTCDKQDTPADSPTEPALKRHKGRNSKALLAIERAKAKGAVICTCRDGGTCVCSTGGGSCCRQGSGHASTSATQLQDICCLPPMDTLTDESLAQIFRDPLSGDTASFHHFPPSNLPVAPLVQVPSIGVPPLKVPGSCCHRTSDVPSAPTLPGWSLPSDLPPSFVNPLVPEEGAVFHHFTPSALPPPSYHQAPHAPVFSLTDLSTAAGCAGGCRPDREALDPVLANLFSTYTSMPHSPSLEVAPRSQGCACSGSSAPALGEIIAGADICTSCGPSCKCGAKCACGKMAALQFPADFDVETLLQELLEGPPPVVDAPELFSEPAKVPIKVESEAAEEEVKPCCCSK